MPVRYMTSRYHGLSLDLLDRYARYLVNSKDHAWTCGSLRPNDLGLFDMLGNAYEWVQDEYQAYGAAKAEVIADDSNIYSHVTNTIRILRGGTFVQSSGGRPLGVPSQERPGVP